MPSEYVLVNGIPEVTHFNRPNRVMSFGDGLFETMLLHDGQIHLLDFHMRRLAQGLNVLGLDIEIEKITRQILTLVEHYSLTENTFRVKVMVSRVPIDGSSIGYSTTNTEISTLLSAQPFSIHYSNDLNVGVSPVRLAEQPLLAGIKHCNRLEQVLAKRAQESSEYDDCLLLSNAGNVIEAVSSNVFILEGEKLVTPILKMCGVEGVMRAYILNIIAERHEIFVAEENIDLHRVSQSDGIFLTNALSGVRLVSQCNMQLHDDVSNSQLPDSTCIEWPRHPLLVNLQEVVHQSILGV